MYTYTINVAVVSSRANYFEHLFRITDIADLPQATNIANRLHVAFPAAKIEITQWSRPCGITIPYTPTAPVS